MYKYIYIIIECIISSFLYSCKYEELPENSIVLNLREGMSVSILGDSYSTFKGFLYPTTNPSYYPDDNIDVKDVTNTWWNIFVRNNHLYLECNNSYSGSTISKSSTTSNSSYLDRCSELGNPDFIFIFGGTNDAWQHVPLGPFIYKDFDQQDLSNFRPAFAFLIEKLHIQYPGALLINIINSNLNKSYKSSMEAICKHYNVFNISLRDIDKKKNHPTVKGMKDIVDEISRRINIEQ